MAEGKEQQVQETQALPDSVTQALFLKSDPNPNEFTTRVEGYHFSKPDQPGGKVDYHALLESFRTSGFQATNFGLAVDQVNQMVCGCSVDFQPKGEYGIECLFYTLLCYSCCYNMI